MIMKIKAEVISTHFGWAHWVGNSYKTYFDLVFTSLMLLWFVPVFVRCEEDEPEIRQAADGEWYTESEFVDYYGGRDEWETAKRQISWFYNRASILCFCICIIVSYVYE